MLELDKITTGYGEKDIIRNISFGVDVGECLGIIGPNGCGKTTLFKTITNILPYTGEIKLDGQSTRKMKPRQIAAKIAMLSQLPGVYFSYTVFDTVMMGRYLHIKDRLLGLPAAEDKAQVMHCLEAVGLAKEKDSEITKLSGGQLQRVFLARTLAQEPQIILLDEPTNHLDLKYQIELIEYLKIWVQGGHRAVIGVLHDLNLALSLSDKLLVMKEGTVQAYGQASETISCGLLEETYEIDVAGHMRKTLSFWNGVRR